jgi:uncharacterized membrane protein
MPLLRTITAADLAAFLLFAACWLGYEPLLKRLTRRGPEIINSHMTVVRTAWMQAMSRREARFLDSQLLGHVLTSASFFASSNLIIIAAAAGTLFKGGAALSVVRAAPLVASAPTEVLRLKLGLIVIVLGRSLLSMIWAIRQLNYCLAAIGAAPDAKEAPERLDAYGAAAAAVLNPALSSFNAGVRGYYFALAAASWLLGPAPFAVITLGAIALLVWRQVGSSSAAGVRALRALLEADGKA